MSIRSLSVAAERSIVDYIQNSLSGSVVANFYTGQNNEDISAPAVKVEALSAQEVYYGTNVFRLNVTVEVKEMAYDTDKENIGILAENVFNCFYNIKDRAGDFTNDDYGFAVFQIIPLDLSTEVVEDSLSNKHTFDFICCLSGTNFP